MSKFHKHLKTCPACLQGIEVKRDATYKGAPVVVHEQMKYPCPEAQRLAAEMVKELGLEGVKLVPDGQQLTVMNGPLRIWRKDAMPVGE